MLAGGKGRPLAVQGDDFPAPGKDVVGINTVLWSNVNAWILVRMTYELPLLRACGNVSLCWLFVFVFLCIRAALWHVQGPQ